MANDLDDLDFGEKIKKMFGYDDSRIDELLSKIDGNQLLELNDAVVNDDREAAEKIINDSGLDEDGDNSVNPLFRPSGDDDIELSSNGDEIYEVGERVKVKVNVDGKPRLVRAVVNNPDAPRGTVEVKIGSKTRMVDKHNIEKLEESIIGMVGMPSLHRMQELAGIVPTEIPSEVQVEYPDTEIDQDQQQVCPKSRVFAAIGQLRNDIPNITVADLKDVRQKLNELMGFLNEGFKPNLGRKPKK